MLPALLAKVTRGSGYSFAISRSAFTTFSWVWTFFLSALNVARYFSKSAWVFLLTLMVV
jgi:hypothetical protein